jgi:carotenoid 1,2-hydratase
MDSNEGDEAIEKGFVDWDWSRARLHDGSTAVIYDVRPSSGPGRVIAQQFATDGTTRAFEPPALQRLPASMWRVSRSIRTDPGTPARVLETLEDTPFYVRSTLASRLLGEDVISIHESLSIPRLVSLPVRLMLPWRMPRLA